MKRWIWRVSLENLVKIREPSTSTAEEDAGRIAGRGGGGDGELFVIIALLKSRVAKLYPTENGCDVTAYFMLGRTKTHRLLSVRGRICAQLQKGQRASTSTSEKDAHKVGGRWREASSGWVLCGY